MAADDFWRHFLERWSRAILASPDAARLGLPPEVVDSGWLGLDPATDEQIAAAEARLGVRLPPSYRAFLRVTNGWRYAGDVGARLRPVEEIDWFRTENQDWIDAYTSPIADDPASGAVDYRHLSSAIQISDVGDAAVMLLIPAVTGPDGECEAWFFANWVPGAEVYPSFREMLEQSYDSEQTINAQRARQVAASDPPDTVAAKLPGLLAELEGHAARFRQTAEGAMGYSEGVAAGLDEATDRVRSLSRGRVSPVDLRSRLRDLAAELDAEAARVEREQRQQTDLSTLWSAARSFSSIIAHMGDMHDAIGTAGRAQGLHQAAGIVRWFLGDD
jgi:hypothetical protein